MEDTLSLVADRYGNHLVPGVGPAVSPGLRDPGGLQRSGGRGAEQEIS